ncbi:MAG: CDP-glycerol glycerophosphotransferase family protein [Eubacterium sp.]|nr:CDP-glycerol glycerophosphotransferase family protein [Eubacterium sp.]
MNKKNIGYRLFGLTFSVFRLFGIRQKKVFLIATHDDGSEGNIAIAANEMKRLEPGLRFYRLTKKDRESNLFSFFFVKAYHMATSRIILLDNTFMPMAYTPVSRRTTVIQLWHGTGTIKKFGLDADTEEIASLARRGNKRIDWLIVNGERTKCQYETAFGIPPERIRMIGLPRTDRLLNAEYMKSRRAAFFSGIRDVVREPEKHRYILYAPTFRDNELDNPKLRIDPVRILRELPEDVVILLRFHPYVAERFAAGLNLRRLPDEYKSRVIDVSLNSGVTTLMAAADVLVTDYSSIIFEYALLRRPMVFYAYDLEDFTKNGRDFYEPYEEFVPGPIVTEDDGLVKELSDLFSPEGDYDFDREDLESFLKENYRRMDGRAASRVAALALRGKHRFTAVN